MTEQEKQDLLEEAKRRYPIGTIFASTLSPSHSICNVKDLEYEIRHLSRHDFIIQNSNGGWVYERGRWADIHILPDIPLKNIINEYEIF